MAFSLKTASDHLLAHWTHSMKQSGEFAQLTKELLDEMQELWLSENEYRQLTHLFNEGQKDLVYRYLDLQLFLRGDDQSSAKHLSIELEKGLDDYLKNPSESPFKQTIALRVMENCAANWLESLGLNRPPLVKDLTSVNFGIQIKHLIAVAMKETGFKLSPNVKILLEEFMETSEESLEYWNRICVCFEQLLLWEKALDELNFKFETKAPDPENIRIQTEMFEKQLLSFHHYFFKQLIENILKNFSEKVSAALLGHFRKKFRELNNSYSKFKNELFDESIDLHLCCNCDFCKKETPPVIDLTTLQSANPLPSLSTKSLLIFTCAGGLGHLSVARAMSEYGKGKYHIEIANTLEETLASTDFFKRMLFNFSQEKLYNYLLRKEEFEWLKVMTSIGLFFFLMQQESLEKQIRLEVLRRNPDMLISCFPCLNPMFLNVAKELNLPLLMVTTDLDTNLYTKGMNKQTCDLSYPKWRMTLAYDTPEMRAVIEKRIPPEKIHISGFPVRPAFKMPTSDTAKQMLCKKFGITEKDRCLIVTIGGVAGKTTQKYAEVLATLTDEEISTLTEKNLHIICLCGNQKFSSNLEMRLHIDTLIPKSNHLRIHGIGNYNEMATLMDIADAIITKPGGCTTNEAIEKKLPMIFHAPFALMDWEVFNMEFCISKQIGARFKFQGSSHAKNKERLLPLIAEAFQRKRAFPTYPFEKKDFGKEFLTLVDDLLELK